MELMLTGADGVVICRRCRLADNPVLRAKGRVLVRNSLANRCLFDALESSPPRGLSRLETRTLREAGEALSLRDFLDACQKLNDA